MFSEDMDNKNPLQRGKLVPDIKNTLNRIIARVDITHTQEKDW